VGEFEVAMSGGIWVAVGEYVRELIRKDRDRLQLRGLLLAGAASNPAAPADAGYFDGLRDRVRKAANTNAKA
jgi:antitoxin ParD1/3/4